jgi:hypothetical protein
MSSLLACDVKGKIDEAHVKIDSMDRNIDSIQIKLDSLVQQMSDTANTGFQYVPFDSTKPHTILDE